MTGRLALAIIGLLLFLPEFVFAEAQIQRIWVLHDSDPVFLSWRRAISESRRYRGRYVDEFEFRPLSWAEYRIKADETLQTIAVRLGVSVDALASANGLVNLHEAKPGDRLLIPNFDGISYKSSSGVSLKDLAGKYDVSRADIKRFNSYSGEWLAAGASLFIPGGTMSPLEQGLFYGTAFSPPLDSIVITSGYGVRCDPFSGREAFHGGVDLAAPSGTPVKAAHEGVVEYSGWAGGYGNLVVIKHAFGYRTLYGHLSVRSVLPGTRIARGGVLGRVGSTGASTGPHLHFEIQHHGARLDPSRYTMLEHRDHPLAAPPF